MASSRSLYFFSALAALVFGFGKLACSRSKTTGSMVIVIMMSLYVCI
jgi:hypothetical protein